MEFTGRTERQVATELIGQVYDDEYVVQESYYRQRKATDRERSGLGIDTVCEAVGIGVNDDGECLTVGVKVRATARDGREYTISDDGPYKSLEEARKGLRTEHGYAWELQAIDE